MKHVFKKENAGNPAFSDRYYQADRGIAVSTSFTQ